MDVLEEFTTKKIGDKEVVELNENRFVIVHGWLECVSGLEGSDVLGFERIRMSCTEQGIPPVSKDMYFISGRCYPILDWTNGSDFTVLNEANEEVLVTTFFNEYGNKVCMDWFNSDEYKNKPIFFPSNLEDSCNYPTFRIPIGSDIKWVF